MGNNLEASGSRRRSRSPSPAGFAGSSSPQCTLPQSTPAPTLPQGQLGGTIYNFYGPYNNIAHVESGNFGTNYGNIVSYKSARNTTNFPRPHASERQVAARSWTRNASMDSSRTFTVPDQVALPSASQDQPAPLTWDLAIGATLKALEQASDVFPPLKNTAASLGVIRDTQDVSYTDQQEFEKLTERVKLLEAILRSVPPTVPPDFEGRRNGLTRAIDELTRTFAKKTDGTLVQGSASTLDGMRDVVQMVREINFAIEITMLDVTIENGAAVLRPADGIDWLKDGCSDSGDTRLEQITTSGASELLSSGNI